MISLQNINYIFAKCSTYAVVIPILISVFNYKAFDKTLKALFFYLLVILFFEIEIWNTPPGSIFTLLEYISIYSMFYFTSQHQWIKVYFKYVALFFIVFTIIELIFWPEEDYLIVVEYLLIITLTLIYYFELLRNLNVPVLSNFPFFYFNTAFLIYFCGSFFIFLFSKQVTYLDKTIIKSITLFHSLLNILYLSLIATGIWKANKK